MSNTKGFGAINPRNHNDAEGAQIIGEAKTVATKDCRPNTYNYNAQSSEVFGKLVNSMRLYGFTKPLVCRSFTEVPGYEIIDGEHRWRAAQQLSMPNVMIVDLGLVDDVTAKQLSIVLNELGGSPDQVRLAELLRDINTDVSIEDLSKVMPFSDKELKMLTEIVDFSFASMSGEDTRPALTTAEQEAIDGKKAEKVAEAEEKANKPQKTQLTFSYEAEKADEISRRLEAVMASPEKALEKLLDAWEAKPASKAKKPRKSASVPAIEPSEGAGNPVAEG